MYEHRCGSWRHIEIINQAAELGELTVGVLTDEVVSAYKRYPLLSCEERMKIVAGLKGVAHVIKQTDISYREPLKTLRPDYVVHGDGRSEQCLYKTDRMP